MSQKIRTKPNKANRHLLNSLKTARVLYTEKIGIRNIIKAGQDTIVSLGLDIPNAEGFLQRPDNFHPYYPIRSAYVTHEKGSAFLSATPGHIRCAGCPGDPSTLFSPNQIADTLFQQSKPGNDTYVGSMGNIYGDALLITDVRQHWIVANRCLVDQSEANDLCSQLITPYVVSQRYHVPSGSFSIKPIVFVQEPCEEDLIYLAMKFS